MAILFTLEEDGMRGTAECGCRERFFLFDFEHGLNIHVEEGQLSLVCPYCLTEKGISGDIELGEWDY